MGGIVTKIRNKNDSKPKTKRFYNKHEKSDKPVYLSKDILTKLRYLADNYQCNFQQTAQYLIEKEYSRFVNSEKIFERKDKLLNEIKENSGFLNYRVVILSDIVYYVSFLKDLRRVCEKVRVIHGSMDSVLVHTPYFSRRQAQRIHYTILKYYPFDSLRLINFSGWRRKGSKTIKQEIVAMGREIQILIESEEMTKGSIIRNLPVLFKSDNELLEEIISWG